MPLDNDPRILGEALHRLPGFPPAITAVVQACASEDCGVAEIAEAVAREEVISAQVVRAANAASLGSVRAVDNVVLAVGRLGSSAIRGIAVAHFLSGSVAPAMSRAGVDRQAVWRHHLAVAAASSGAAGSSSERSDAHLAGLMHDVGKLIFAAQLGPDYAECLAEAERSGDALATVETRQFGLSHAELGAEAARQWRFAPGVIEAMAYHHADPASGALPDLAINVMVGDAVASAMGYGAALTSPHGCETSADPVIAQLRERAQRALAREAPRIEAMLTAATAGAGSTSPRTP